MREYLGARGARFAIFPGSGLHRKNPQFLMAGELVETSRLWARQNAAIKPEWAERLGEHLVKRTYSEPHWSKKRAAVMAHERVTLYGVPLVADRLDQLRQGRRRAVAASSSSGTRSSTASGARGTGSTRQNLRAARGGRGARAPGPAPRHRGRRAHALRLLRRPGRAPRWSAARTSTSGGSRRGSEQPELLTFDPAMLTHDTAEEVRAADYPETLGTGEGLTFPISYHFEPGAADDGLTIDVPVATLNRVDADDFSWNVPGLREELVTSLIRSLPKNLRVNFVPAPNKAREFLAAVPAGGGAAARRAGALAAARPPASSCRARPGTGRKVPEHLRPTYRVVDDAGREQARGKDLEALKEPLRPHVRAGHGRGRRRQRDRPRPARPTGSFGTIEASFTQKRAGHEVRGFPALVDEGDDGRAAGLRLGGRAGGAAPARGPPAAAARRTPSPVKAVLDGLDNAQKLGLAGSPYPSVAELLDDCRRRGASGTLVDARPPVRDEAAYAALRAAAAPRTRRRTCARVLADVIAGARTPGGRPRRRSAAAPTWRCCPRCPT